MHRRTLLVAALLAATHRWAQAAERLKLVATFSILADMASVIGGEDVTVTSLVPFDADAHVWEPRPADLRAVGDAGLLIENGLGLEGWMTRLPKAAGFRGQVVTAARDVIAHTVLEGKTPVTDPHAWQDPANGVRYAKTIAAALASAFSAAAPAIEARATAYVAAIEDTDRWIAATIGAVPPSRRRILTSHDAFGYYCARYGIAIRAIQGISTEGEPSARDIATLIGQIRRENIRAIFVENMTSPRMAQAVARETGVTIGAPLYSDSLSPPGGPAPSYLAMLRHNTNLLAAAMADNPD
jgi:zinc/manganese transport system substrate-binding protein